MNKIKNLIIDLGGVMIDLDRDRCVRHFEQLGLSNVNNMLGLYRQEEPFLSIETGRVSAAQFYDHIRGLLADEVTDSEIEEAFDAFLVGLPRERLAALRQAREAGYKTYMLSNTNGIMYDGWIKRAFRSEGLEVGDYFDGIITSFAEGVCKPDVRIFKVVLDRYGLNPDETILLDDSQDNCKAAAGLGIHTLRITPELNLIAALRKIAE